jgi:hypothetical protein
MIARIEAALAAARLAYRVAQPQPDQWQPIYVAAPASAVRRALPRAILAQAQIEGDMIYLSDSHIAIYCAVEDVR